MDTNNITVTWNGVIERQFTEAIRAEANRPLPAAVRDPSGPVFKPASRGAELEAYIRQQGRGVVYTARGVAELLGVERNTAATMLRRAAQRGLLMALQGETMSPRLRRPSVEHIARYTSLG